jgi:hypothetical protein
MTTHDIPERRSRAPFVVGVSVAVGLVVSVGLQVADDVPPATAVHAGRLDCPAVIAL